MELSLLHLDILLSMIHLLFNFVSKRCFFPPVEVPWCVACSRPTLNLERRLDHEGHPLAITAADAVAASGVPPWNWRETPGNGNFINYI